MPEQPLVSVLTPVYNGAEFIEECVDSVLAQTYENWRYVLVDNVSTDGSREILAGYARRDPRIRVVAADEHVPVIQNFNRTFAEVGPDARWVKALAADDWLFPECLERMVAAGEQSPSIGIVGGYRVDGDRVNLDGLPVTETVFSGRDLCRQSLLRRLQITGSSSSTLIRADLVRGHQPFYDPTLLGSDTDACHRIFREHDVGWVHQVVTFTRRHTGSVTQYTHRVHTYTLENMRQLVRYGPYVLEPGEYRSWLRSELRGYLWFLSKQAVKGRTVRDEELLEFHLRQLPLLEAESYGDADVVRTARVARALMSRAPASVRPG